MQELAKTLTDVMEKYAPEKQVPDSELLNAAQAWANYCLKNMQGDLLRRGLAVSEAIANFDVGFFHPETLKY